MKKKLLHFTWLAMILLATACRSRKLFVSPESGSGVPGDIVQISISNLAKQEGMRVGIGNETAIIASKSDTLFSIMVPSVAAGPAQIKVTSGKQRGTANFEVNAASTVRLWFSYKNSAVQFLLKQPSNESFIRDKSHSVNKLIYELLNDQNKLLASGYINDPTELEILSQDRKGFSKTISNEEVKFDINVPAFTDMKKMRILLMNATTNYQPKLIGETTISTSSN